MEPSQARLRGGVCTCGRVSVANGAVLAAPPGQLSCLCLLAFVLLSRSMTRG